MIPIILTGRLFLSMLVLQVTISSLLEIDSKDFS